MAISALIIDDSEASHLLLTHILADLDVTLHSAHDGPQGLAMAKDVRPSLVLLDIQMPGMDGFEVLQRLREQPESAQATVIFLSAVEGSEAKIRGLSGGAADYITKPFDPAEVVARVQGQLARIRRESTLREQIDAALQARARRKRSEAPLLGDSEVADDLRDRVSHAARAEQRSFLVGEPGTGDAVVARLLHEGSGRREAPLVELRHARDRAPDRLAHHWQLADGGHLFVPDAQELEPAVLEQLEACSLEDPGRLILSVSRRAELPAWWAREACQVIDLLPLRERLPDIPVMALHLLQHHLSALDGRSHRLSDDSQRRLTSYGWPGNIDELERVLKATLAGTYDELIEIDPSLLSGGPVAGPYQLLEVLDRGGMGSVYRARHRSLGQEAVVKLIEHKGDQRSARRQFREEARVTSQLSSHHTVRLFDFGITDDGAFYYAMERLYGMHLRKLVDTHGALPAARAIHLLEQATASLEEAHAAGLVHSDIKPENLFVCRAGLDRDVLKVLDFGVVRQTGASGTLVGTPHYMAPEVLGARPVDARTDLYALGCVAMYLLTGKTVFQAASMPALLMAHLEQMPEPPSHRVAGVPAALDTLVASLLHKDPDHRPPSATALRRTLRALAADHPWTQDDARDWWAMRAAPDGSTPADMATTWSDLAVG